MIKHTHNVHMGTQTGSPEGSIDGAHSNHTGGEHGHGTGAHSNHAGGAHVHAINTRLQGNNPTAGVGHVGRVSDQLTYMEDYSHDPHVSMSHTRSSTLYEQRLDISAAIYVNPIVTIGQKLKEDVAKLKDIQENMYTDIETFNNNYGSPWTEIYQLDKDILQRTNNR